MNNYSRVVVKKNLSFPWRDIVTGLEKATVSDVLGRCESGDAVTVTAKVMWKSESEVIFSTKMNKDLKKCDIVVADSTGVISVTLFEDVVDHVEVEKSYVLDDFKVAYFRKTCLNSTPSSTITPHEDIEVNSEIEKAAEEIIPKQYKFESVTGTVVAVEAKKLFTCLNCKAKISDVEDTVVVVCPACKLTIRKSKMQVSVNAKIVISGDDNEVIGRFKATTAALNSMVKSLAGSENYNIDAEIVRDVPTPGGAGRTRPAVQIAAQH